MTQLPLLIFCQKIKKAFVDIMMVEELGLALEDDDESSWKGPAKNGGVTFIAFLIFGLVPLISYIIGLAFSNDRDTDTVVFFVAIFLTLFTMFSLGAVTSKFTSSKWWKAGLFFYGEWGICCWH